MKCLDKICDCSDKVNFVQTLCQDTSVRLSWALHVHLPAVSALAYVVLVERVYIICKRVLLRRTGEGRSVTYDFRHPDEKRGVMLEAYYGSTFKYTWCIQGMVASNTVSDLCHSWHGRSVTSIHCHRPLHEYGCGWSLYTSSTRIFLLWLGLSHCWWSVDQEQCFLIFASV